MNEREMMKAKLEQIKQLVERAYANQGFEYDSLRRIGDLTGAKLPDA